MSKSVPIEEIDKKNIVETEIEGLVSFQFEGFELLEKKVKQSGNSGRVYLPNSWIGAKVKIIRISPVDAEDD
jgi:hypothetical protein